MPDGVTVRDAMQPEWGTLRFFSDTPPTIEFDDGTSLSDARFLASGPTSRKLDYTIGATRFWGIGFLPLGWATFAMPPAHLMADQIVDGLTSPHHSQFLPLASILLNTQAAEQEQLEQIIQFFSEGCPRAKREDPRIARIHQSLLTVDSPNVAVMAEECGVSGRTLERLCRQAFGFSPKLLIRRQRFMRSLADFMLDPERSWSNAIDSSYYDQSHFVRDSHRFLGMTPREYAALDHPILSEFMRNRVKRRGSPVQTLDSPVG
ncbi:hypothetical protein GCM10023115_02870 [Pontixanthobacter gangjinensis]